MNLLALMQQHPGLWRGRELAPGSAQGLPSGFAELDARLPGGGWPVGALIEVLHADIGIGELELFMPALARLSQESRWAVWIDPPWLPYAPALAARGIDLSRVLIVHAGNRRDSLWTLEQTLRCGDCSLVLAWPKRVEGTELRRLQLAAETGGATGVLFHPRGLDGGLAIAALRLRLQPAGAQGVKVEILRCRGRWNPGAFWLRP